ncbi:MAG: exo-alpha-sialidase [Candidatus Heritagella sp.]
MNSLLFPGTPLLPVSSDAPVFSALLPTACPSNHAPCLTETPEGDLLCAWFSGRCEGSRDTSIVSARLPAGKTRWQYTGILSEDPTRSEQNPSFFWEGETLWLYHTAQETRGDMDQTQWENEVKSGRAQGSFFLQETAQIRRRCSLDQGQTWLSTETFAAKAGSFCRSPMVRLQNGTHLFPLWHCPPPGERDDTSAVFHQPSGASGWTEIPVPGSEKRVHMNILETAPNRCVAFFRSRAADWIYRSLSLDGGKSWSVPQPTPLPNNNASLSAIVLKSGRIAIAYNDTQAAADSCKVRWPGMRWRICIALTEDEGQTFPYIRCLDMGSGLLGSANQTRNMALEYPCLLQTRDGRLHAVYAYHNRQCIRYQSFSEEWILGEE